MKAKSGKQTDFRQEVLPHVDIWFMVQSYDSDEVFKYIIQLVSPVVDYSRVHKYSDGKSDWIWAESKVLHTINRNHAAGVSEKVPPVFNKDTSRLLWRGKCLSVHIAEDTSCSQSITQLGKEALRLPTKNMRNRSKLIAQPRVWTFGRSVVIPVSATCGVVFSSRFLHTSQIPPPHLHYTKLGFECDKHTSKTCTGLPKYFVCKHDIWDYLAFLGKPLR